MIFLKIKIERTKKEPKAKKNKTKVLKLGTHKKSILALWGILILSVSFGVYKNFTAIDQHTTHEETVITEKLVDTSGIQSYVKNFAQDYFTWENKKASIEARTKKIGEYLTEDLQQLNTDLVRLDIPTSSMVKEVQIVKVDKTDSETYHVTFTIQQEITEGKKIIEIQSAYETTVHQDTNGAKVIIQNPTMTANTEKSTFKPKVVETDGGVDSELTDEVTKFLETFFKLYPKATKDELTYYVKSNQLQPIQDDLIYSKIGTLIIQADKNNEAKVSVNVEYLDQKTKMTQIYQYQLILKKQKNWMIESSSLF
ncbi:conjugal transfer protein [Enterococcus asini]|nr:conjugal transfer protein [Enterococcus asini]